MALREGFFLENTIAHDLCGMVWYTLSESLLSLAIYLGWQFSRRPNKQDDPNVLVSYKRAKSGMKLLYDDTVSR